MQIHEKYNLTPFVSDFVFCQDKDGQNLVTAIVKAGFSFDENGKTAISEKETMLPILGSDIFYEKKDDSAGSPGIQYPTDIVPKKNGTDIVINGHAYGKNKKQVVCGFTLGNLKKIVKVSGHRHWSKFLGINTIIGPIPFDKISLTYENAFGGWYEDKKKGLCQYEYNPVGTGFGAKHHEKLILPNIEYLDSLVKSTKSKSRPAGFNAIPVSWKPRAQYKGTYGDEWQESRYPLLPINFDERFYNAVPDDQIYRPKLCGGEVLKLINIHPLNPEIILKIPEFKLKSIFRIKQNTHEISMKIDTCLIEPDENRLTLTYRSSFQIGSDVKYLKSIHFMKQ